MHIRTTRTARGLLFLLTALSLGQAHAFFGSSKPLYQQLMEAKLDQDAFNAEDADHGVESVNEVYMGKTGKDTPLSVPGATTINTGQLLRLMQADPSIAIVDVGYKRKALSVPYAMFWRHVGKGDAEKYDRSSEDLTRHIDFMLKQVKWAAPARPVVFLAGPYKGKDHPWLSYNAALRAVKLGYSDIYWYRGGQEAWSAAGLPTMSLMPPGSR